MCAAETSAEFEEKQLTKGTKTQSLQFLAHNYVLSCYLLHQLQHAHNLWCDLARQAENMAIILREASGPEQAMHRS